MDKGALVMMSYVASCETKQVSGQGLEQSFNVPSWHSLHIEAQQTLIAIPERTIN